MTSLRSNKIRDITLRYSELNFRSWILKFRFQLQKPRSFEASVGYIVIIFIIFLIIFIIMFLIIPTIFFNNIFSSFLAAFLYSKKGAKIKKRTHRSSIPCKNVKIMKKCSKNSVFFTIWISEFGASIFGRSNCPNISEFRIIRISGLQLRSKTRFF